MRQPDTFHSKPQTPLHGIPNREEPPHDEMNLEDMAREYVGQGEYRKAIDVFEVNDLSSLESMLTSFRSELPFDKVRELIDAAIDVYADSPGIKSQLGWLHYTDERYEDALVVFDQILSEHQNHAPALQGKIASLRMLRRFQAAEALLLDAAERFRGHWGIQSERGWLYFDQKKYDKAVEVFEKIYEEGDTSVLKWIISCLRSQRRFDEVPVWLRKGFAVNPSDVEILNEEAWLNFDKKQYDNALKKFDEALGIDANHEFALHGKIASLRLLGRLQEAEELLRQALVIHPKSTGLLSERGWLLVDLKQSTRANQSFEAAVDFLPNRIPLRFNWIDALIAMNDGQGALESLKELKERYSDDIEIMDRLGQLYLRRNDSRSAEKEFQAIFKLDRSHLLGLNGLGAVYFSQGRYADATKTFREVVEKYPDNALAYTNLARVLVRREDVGKRRWRPSGAALLLKADQRSAAPTRLEEAEQFCKKALELDSKSAHAYGCRGIIAFKRGNLREAEEFFQKSIQMDSQEGSYRDLGALYVITKQYDQAEENLKKALENNKDDAVAHLELGYLYMQTGRAEQAMREFHHARFIDLNNDEPARAIATMHIQNHNFDEGEDILRKALRTLDKSRKWQIHLTLSRLLAQKGDETEDSVYYEEALAEAKTAKRLKPEHSDPYFHVGVILAKQKDYRGALKNFRLCLSKDRNHNEADVSKRRVQAYLRKQRSGSYFWVGFWVGVLCVSQLVLLWYFFSQNKVNGTELSVLIPVLLGFVMVGFLLPWVIKFKVPGLEVGLIEHPEPIYQGPKGDIGFSKASPTISSGPR